MHCLLGRAEEANCTGKYMYVHTCRQWNRLEQQRKKQATIRASFQKILKSNKTGGCSLIVMATKLFSLLKPSLGLTCWIFFAKMTPRCSARIRILMLFCINFLFYFNMYFNILLLLNHNLISSGDCFYIFFHWDVWEQNPFCSHSAKCPMWVF